MNKPALFPPPIAFPVVWSILYLLMGVALALVVTAPASRWKRPAIFGFAVQLALNLAWSPVFFGAQEIGRALLVIAALALALVATIVLFGRIDRRAALLLAPYLVWVLFASGFNWQLWQDNPAADRSAQAETAAVERAV